MFSFGFKKGTSALCLQVHIAYQQFSIYPTREEGKHFLFYFLLPISRENIVFGSNFRNGGFDGLM